MCCFVGAINNSAGSEIGNLFLSSIDPDKSRRLHHKYFQDGGKSGIGRHKKKTGRKSKDIAGFAQRPQVSGQGLRFHSPETA